MLTLAPRTDDAMNLTSTNPPLTSKVTKMLAIAVLMVTCGHITAMAQTPSKKEPRQPPPFYACQMTYAYCVSAPCEGAQITGSQVTTTCQCPVVPTNPVVPGNWSVGAKDCAADAPTQTTVASRYFPIKTYARCTKKRAWAMCLDSPCVLNRDKTTAACTCLLMQGQGDFVYAPDKPAQCDSGIISSATVEDVATITDWLETQDKIPVYDFTVVNKQKK